MFSATEFYARITRERALSEAVAAAARAKSGARLGLLDGVPISWKDLFDTAGIKTEAGSALLKDRVPEHDAQVVAGSDQCGTDLFRENPHVGIGVFWVGGESGHANIALCE